MNSIFMKLGISPYDFEPVSLVSIDEDWSAMRFRHVDNIKTI